MSEARPADQFNDKTFHWETYCGQIGRLVARAEEHEIFRKVMSAADNRNAVSSFGELRSAVDQAVAELAGYSTPPLLILPVKLSVPGIFSDGLVFDRQTADNVVTPHGQVRVIWTGEESIDNALLYHPDAVDWHVKLEPETGNRLRVAIGTQSADPGSVLFLAETVARCDPPAIGTALAIGIGIDLSKEL